MFVYTYVITGNHDELTVLRLLIALSLLFRLVINAIKLFWKKSRFTQN